MANLTTEAGTANSGTGAHATESNQPPAVETKPGTGDGNLNPGAQIDPAKVEEIAGKRSEQASKAALKSYFQQRGMTEAEAEAAFTAFKVDKAAKAEADKGNLTALQAKFEKAELDKTAAIEKANGVMVKAEAKLIAGTLGIKPERIDAVIRLADLSRIQVTDDGIVDVAAVKAALEAGIKDIPELKNDQSGTPGFKIGADGSGAGSNGNKPAQNTLTKRWNKFH